MGMIDEIIESISFNNFKKQILDSDVKSDFASIELKNINFTYNNADKKILSNFNITINKGDKVGIIGKSGSGKSTLVDIIMGLLKPSEGEIILNDTIIDFEKDKFKVRNNFSHVPQNYFILNRNNKRKYIIFFIKRKSFK